MINTINNIFNIIGMVDGLLKKDINKFLPYYENIVWNKPNFENIYNLGIIYYEIKNYNKALMSFRLIYRQNPNYRDIKRLINEVEHKLGIKIDRESLLSKNFQFINEICLKLNLNYNISINSQISEIRKVRRIISKNVHPDTKSDAPEELKTKLDDLMKKINNAFEIIEKEINKPKN